MLLTVVVSLVNKDVPIWFLEGQTISTCEWCSSCVCDRSIFYHLTKLKLAVPVELVCTVDVVLERGYAMRCVQQIAISNYKAIDIDGDADIAALNTYWPKGLRLTV